MSDPFPFLNSDASLVLAVVGLAGLWYAIRKSESGRRVFLWVVGFVFVLFMAHNALWGTCGRWGPWRMGTPEERHAYEDFCTEPREEPR